MAYLEPTILLVAGDDSPNITVILKDKNTAASGMVLDECDSTTWAPIDITDPTVSMNFQALGSTTVLDTLVATKVGPYTDGEVFFIWNTDTLDVAAGLYEGEIFLTYTSGRVHTMYHKLKFKIRGVA